MKRGSKVERVPRRGNVLSLAVGQHSAAAGVSPEMQSWIRNVIVPALLDEWIEEHGGEKFLASLSESDAKSESMAPSTRPEVCR